MFDVVKIMADVLAGNSPGSTLGATMRSVFSEWLLPVLVVGGGFVLTVWGFMFGFRLVDRMLSRLMPARKSWMAPRASSSRENAEWWGD